MIPKPGNPRGAPREALIKITFKLDSETAAKLAELERDYGPNVRGRTSAVLRKAIHDQHARLRK